MDKIITAACSRLEAETEIDWVCAVGVSITTVANGEQALRYYLTVWGNARGKKDAEALPPWDTSSLE